MNCLEARQHWHLFHDSEGDAEVHLQINEHLRQCRECARWFTQQSALEESLARSLKGGMEPASALWDKLEGGLEPPQPARPRKWLLFGSAFFALAASFFALAASLLIAVGLGLFSSTQTDLVSLSVALHDKLASGQERPKFASTSHLEIEDYLKQHVSFPVRCPPREDAGFEALGGGTCTLSDDPVAYVVGRVDGEEVSLFILSRDSLAHFPEQQERLLREGTHHRREGELDILMTQFDQNIVLVVGRVSTEKLHRLLRAYGSYAHGHTHTS